ncbi:hypothetical protein ABZ864_09265 [Streptomyces sp. NPDC047082]|uniref:RICIN domain-containing protein n=1 Tax=Streptomyces sp. NPDC047082 TaxID=3155259 RepID=UPI0033FAC861
MKKLRLAAIATIGALATSAAVLLPAPAQAAPTYWTFQNFRFHTCLTAGDSGSAYATLCNNADRQDWDWIGSGDWKQLKNRYTGRCLMTDNKTNVNAVWTSTCNSSELGQQFYYTANLFRLQGRLGGGNESLLRTSDVKDAVYSTDAGQVDETYYQWDGLTH